MSDPRNNEFLLLPQEFRLPIRIVPELLRGFPLIVENETVQGNFPHDFAAQKVGANLSHLKQVPRFR